MRKRKTCLRTEYTHVKKLGRRGGTREEGLQGAASKVEDSKKSWERQNARTEQ